MTISERRAVLAPHVKHGYRVARSMEKNSQRVSAHDKRETPYQNDDESSMFIAVLGDDLDAEGSDIAVSPEALSTAQRTLEQLGSPSEQQSQARRGRVAPFPPITSRHATPLPGTESFLVLLGSFGNNVVSQPTLFPENEGDGIYLKTPTGALRVQGNTRGERRTLQHYVSDELRPDGLKELVGLIDAYRLLASGKDQAQNVEVTAKQVLQRIGKGAHADDKNEQAHLIRTMLYLARALVIKVSSRQTKISPLLVLESITVDEFNHAHLKYHLGEETFEAIYGPAPNRYPLPTPRVIGYHGMKAQAVLLLTFFLGNRLGNHLAQGKEACSLYFTTICTQSGLLAEEKLLPGQKNRMRDTLQVLTALLQLERDEFITLTAHQDLDTALVTNILLGAIGEEQLAPSTAQRLSPTLEVCKGYAQAQLKERRRIAMQRLLNVKASQEEQEVEHPEFCTRLTIYPGPQFVTKQKEFQQLT